MGPLVLPLGGDSLQNCPSRLDTIRGGALARQRFPTGSYWPQAELGQELGGAPGGKLLSQDAGRSITGRESIAQCICDDTVEKLFKMKCFNLIILTFYLLSL